MYIFEPGWYLRNDYQVKYSREIMRKYKYNNILTKVKVKRRRKVI